MRSITTWLTRRRRLSGIAAVLAVLLLGGIGSVGIEETLRRSQQRSTREAMDHYRDELGAAVTDEVSHYGEALNGLAAAISTQKVLTADLFHGMAAGLERDRLPGATGVSFVVRSYGEDPVALAATWRARGATGLVLAPSGPGVEHDYVVFGSSFVGRRVQAGRDLSAVPETAEALRVSRETGAFTMSRAHVLLGDRALSADLRQMSFTLAMPIFAAPDRAGAKKLRGWVVMGVRGGDFLSRTLHAEARDTLQVRLADTAGETVIAAVSGGTRMSDRTLVRERTLVVGQHTWLLTLWPTTVLLSASDRWGGRLALMAGLAITLLLAALVGTLATARNRAMDRVDQATAALREDIRRREEVERELHRLAFHDQLTGLANRGLFYDRVGQALRGHARTGEIFAVFFIDLDGFKQVNDEYGHGAGDLVLRAVADRLRNCLRDGDTVARFGGDEFAVIVERLAGPDDVHATAERIVGAVQRPIDIGDREAVVTASVGIALNRPGDTADDILREADVAMYTAKTTGKSRHVLAG